ncbi:MAG: DUF6145 family protein [Lachnotalea sp.]
MYQDKVVLCGSSSYEKIFYLDENFEALPQGIKEELKIMCVLFTEEVGGILTLVYDDEGNLNLEVTADEEDLLYDEIGSALKIKEIQRTKAELMEALELFYKVFFLNEEIELDTKGE